MTTRPVFLPEEIVTAYASWEIIGNLTDRQAPAFSKRLKVSADLVNKWGRAPGNGTSARNPLDRIECLMATALRVAPKKALTPLYWLANRFGYGTYRLPDPDGNDSIGHETAELIRHFSSTLNVIATAYEDRRITRKEAKQCRREIFALIREARTLLAILEAEAA